MHAVWWPLPDAGHETETPRAAVARVAGQVEDEEALRVEKPHHDPRHQEHRRDQPPPRAEGDRRRQDQESRRGVHRMTDDGVRAGATTRWSPATLIVAPAKLFTRK